VDRPPKAASLEILVREDIAVDSLSFGETRVGEVRNIFKPW
jgi:hypothetical protein